MSPMLTEDQALDALKRSSFRIFIEKTTDENGEKVSWFGTGFFITGSGYALTAYHNLPQKIRKQGFGKVRVYYRELEKSLDLVWCPDLSAEEIDIAVLKLRSPEA